MSEASPRVRPDADPEETQEWVEALGQMLADSGEARTRYIVRRLIEHAQLLGIDLPALVQTPYINTIPTEDEPPFPGDEALERRIRRFIRWNAVAMVLRANQLYDGIGGHLSTYASAASLYEVGFNHFFRGPDHPGGGDLVYIQGHAAPGIYARAFLEGRLSADQLARFRMESDGTGLSSYPHPRLMPEFWQFPTVSMGLGPINAIYQARFNRYLHNRGIRDTSDQRVWAFLGDGECDEPETLGALHLAAREKLDNLTFVINCNLQRLDGPVRGNSKIIQELEAVFHGSGWNVIKVIWGREWDPVFDLDDEHRLVRRVTNIVDGEFQRYSVESGEYIRRSICGDDPELLRLMESVSDERLPKMRRGGHDYRKIYAAYDRASHNEGQPTVILAKTVKGWTLGPTAEARNVAHQVTKLKVQELALFRDKLEIDIPDSDLENPSFHHPGEDSPEYAYLQERRAALGGFVPSRRTTVTVPEVPDTKTFDVLRGGSSAGLQASTTMAFARLFKDLLKSPDLGARIVPILADEARTFGMEPLFKQVGIYASEGQKYEPIDHQLLFSYSEKKSGQILEEGITECGSLASFIAAATSYSTHGEVMVPFYIFYSMFGFQRVGDQIWALGDMRGRGFLLGATAGRTTLNGEGLQHQDGHSLLAAAAVPCCIPYDPAFAYEVGIIIEEGLRRMVTEQEDVFYYLTLYNENLDMPAEPTTEGLREGVLEGLYRVREAAEDCKARVRLLGSGPILRQALDAAEVLEQEHGVGAEVYSATSYELLRREAIECERQRLLHPESPARTPRVAQILPAGGGPVIAASDFVRAVPDSISRWIEGPYTSLGTDGFGMSDTREALRRVFEIDSAAIVGAALSSLAHEGSIKPGRAAEAIRALGIDPDQPNPLIR
jgi:pyruvate dehydrogenase E1 component